MKEKQKQTNKQTNKQTKTIRVSFINYFKEKIIISVKACCDECTCLKRWDLLSCFICSSNLVLKWRQVSPIKLELQLALVNLYTRKDLKSSGIWSL